VRPEDFIHITDAIAKHFSGRDGAHVRIERVWPEGEERAVTTADDVERLLKTARVEASLRMKRLLEMARIIDEERGRNAVAEAYERGDLNVLEGFPNHGGLPRTVDRLRRELREAIEEARSRGDTARVAECEEFLEAAIHFQIGPKQMGFEKSWHQSAVNLAAGYVRLFDHSARWSRDGKAIRFVEQALKEINASTYTGERDAIRKVVTAAGL
jgi:hypothetical protein